MSWLSTRPGVFELAAYFALSVLVFIVILGLLS
jgi:hypothetical protein